MQKSIRLRFSVGDSVYLMVKNKVINDDIRTITVCISSNGITEKYFFHNRQIETEFPTGVYAHHVYKTKEDLIKSM